MAIEGSHLGRQIHVAMIIQAFQPTVGGAERQLAALIPLLQGHGLRISVVTRRHPRARHSEKAQGIRIDRLPAPGPKAVASLSFTAAATVDLLRLKPDIIHAHELLSPTTTAVLAKGLLGVPVIAKVLRGGQLGDIDKLRRRATGRGRLALFRRHVDAFIAISREIDAELAELGVPEARRFYIPNGVDTRHFVPASDRQKQALRRQLGFGAGPLVAYTGRLAAEKRVDQLVDAWPAVRRHHPEAMLLIVGSGDHEAALRARAGSQVRFEGPVDDVKPILQAADLFVLPSITEGLSNALLEAMATGLPCLATRVGGATDVIRHGHNGWLIPPDQPEALLEALVTLLDSPSARARLAHPARQTASDNFALPVVAGRLQRLYVELVQMAQSKSGRLEANR